MYTCWKQINFMLSILFSSVTSQNIAVNQRTGIIQPPRYPALVVQNRLRWTLLVPDAQDLDIPSLISPSCGQNYVIIIDGNKNVPTGICSYKGTITDAGKTRFCNRVKSSQPIKFNSNRLIIEYCTLSSPSGRGFRLTYESDVNSQSPWSSTAAPFNPIPGTQCSMEVSRSDYCGCGKSAIAPTSTRIVGGREARPHSWPWIVHLRRSYNGQLYGVCGAALVSEWHVITAAHCVDGDSDVTHFMARVGEHSKTVTEKDEEDYLIESITIHPNYQRWDNDNDLALLKLIKKVTLKTSVNTVCLPTSPGDPVAGSQATVVGWGETFPQELKNTRGSNISSSNLMLVTTANSTIPPQAIITGISSNSKTARTPASALMQLNVPIIHRDVCKSADYYSYQITQNMLCAGYEQGTMDACKGDSGGPLVQKIDGRFTIIGIVSWGEGCAQYKKPGVYTQVANYLNWIKNAISK